MIIEIESYTGDMMLWGKKIGERRLQAIVKELLTIVSEDDFPSAFCSRLGYESIPYDETLVADYVIDLDTHLVIRPKL